ncbi:head GIN domain-containing protein [Parasphingorhabdus sp. JC815]|uniref:head GIN domain-containing protein n=1 Tax=Parasphingorhabdus sp. JC815 TaxID=3232140 RepID=UPI003458CB56
MMKKLLLLIPFLALSACEGSIAEAVGNAGNSSFTDGTPLGSAEVNPGKFEGVTLAGPDNIIFTTGPEYTIRAEGDADTLEQLRYKITGGEIKVGRENDDLWSSTSSTAIIYISAPSLNSIKLAGSGDIEADKMSGDDTALIVAGSGNITVADLQTPSLDSKVAGSGDISVAGTAQTTKISIAGSGDINGKALTTEDATIKIAGSGNISLSSDGAVEAKIIGSGDVRIYGDATCKTKAMGSGEVTCG